MALSTRGRGAHGAPSGVTTIFRPPRFLNVIGMWTVIVSSVSRNRRPRVHAAALPVARHLAHQPGEPVRPEPDLDAVASAHRPARPAAARSAPARPGTARPTAGRAAVSASRASSSVMSSCSARAARHVPTTISGCRKMPRSWSMTAASISAAGTRPTGQASRPALQHVLADVVAVEPVALAGVRRRHRRAGRPEDQPLQQRRRLRPGARRPGAGVLGEDRVHLVPEVLVDDRRVLARVGGALVDREPEVGPVAEHL